MSLSDEWTWALCIIAVPVILFGAFELMTWVRRRRYEAVARRSKEPRSQSASRPGRGA